MFISLNPSTADEIDDDPTLKRCINFAKKWGYGGLVMANFFAFRATDPADMKKANNPVGPDNDKWLLELATEAEIVVAAWGSDGCFQNRAAEVKRLVKFLDYQKLNKSGQPAHPLYLKADLKPKRWNFKQQ